MHEVIEFPDKIGHRVRLLAEELRGRRMSVVYREVGRAAGRLGEEFRCAGAPRWKAVQIEDGFKDAVLKRLNELSGMSREHPAKVTALAAGGRP